MVIHRHFNGGAIALQLTDSEKIDVVKEVLHEIVKYQIAETCKAEGVSVSRDEDEQIFSDLFEDDGKLYDDVIDAFLDSVDDDILDAVQGYRSDDN